MIPGGQLAALKSKSRSCAPAAAHATGSSLPLDPLLTVAIPHCCNLVSIPLQIFTPVPDSLLARAAAASETVTALDAAPGLSTPMGGTTTDLTAIGGRPGWPRSLLPFLFTKLN